MTLLVMFAMLGLTVAIRHNPILDSIRDKLVSLDPFWYRMLQCSACTGFWVGLFIYLMSCETVQFDGFSIRMMLVWGLGSSGLNHLADQLLTKFLTEKIPVPKKKAAS